MKRPEPCRECGTPEDEVPLVDCSLHAYLPPDPEHPPQLTMDERPFAPPKAVPDLGFIDRANTPVGAMRRSIHRSHRGEGHNFVD